MNLQEMQNQVKNNPQAMNMWRQFQKMNKEEKAQFLANSFNNCNITNIDAIKNILKNIF